MAGLALPSAGEATLSVPAEKMGYLAHETFIYPKLSALENLRFWAGLYGLPSDEERLLAVLDRMGLKRVAFEQAGSFSRGMAQRLSLARALMNEPELLFLDEPGTGLDEASRGVLMREIEACRDRGAAVAWVSHDAMADAARADKVLAFGGGRTAGVMDAGEWLEQKKAAVC
jgi:heme exporter protein A